MKRFAILFSGFFLAAVAAAQSSAPAKNDPPLATVGGQKLTEEDLAPYVQSQLRPLREQEYQIKKKALDSLINQKSLEYHKSCSRKKLRNYGAKLPLSLTPNGNR